MITLIGMGSGTPGSLTAQGLAALQGADRILGAKRLLATLPEGCTGNRQSMYKPDEILACLAAHPDEEIALVYSGDTGFYSGASQLLPMLRAFGISCRVLPGLSSVQLLAAAVGRPWQDWTLVSAHGCACDPVSACMNHKTVFFLTGGAETPATLCAALTAAGLGDAHALVGENLGTPDEKIHFGTAQELALWDVGAGTGSVSVELALAAPQGHVYAVECEPDACALIRRNREKFAAWNLSLIEGRAPAALEALPAPDAVFIGGTKGSMAAVVDTVLAKNANARICIAAIALESLSAAIAALTAHGLSAEVTQLAVSRTRPAGRLHLLTANNPIFLITGERK